MNYRRFRPGFRQEPRVIICAECCVCGDGDGSDFHYAEICGGEFRNIGEKEQYSLFRFDSQVEQRVACTVDLLSDLGVGEPAAGGEDGDISATSLTDVAVHEMIDEIVWL